MDSVGFYLFCLSIGYVVVWFLVNERRGNEHGEWGFLAMRQPDQSNTRSDFGAGNVAREVKSARDVDPRRWRL